MMNSLIFLLLTLVSLVSAEYYSFGGTGNNRDNDDWGATGTTFRRIKNEIDFVSFADGIGVCYNL